MDSGLRFNERYRERLLLPGGQPVVLRLVRPADKERLRQGFLNLSAASRQKRFLAGKQSISEAELRYFTELDQTNHFAIGVVELDAAGEEGEGVGVARFIRLPDNPECAEVALTVIDRMQGQGVGRILLEKLVAAAVERRVRRFRFECLPQNTEIQRLVQKVCHVVEMVNESGTMVAEVELPTERLAAGESVAGALEGLFDLLRAFAADVLELQVSLGMATVHSTLDAAFDPQHGWFGATSEPESPGSM